MYRYMYSGQLEFLFRSPPRPRAHHTASKLGRVGCCIPYLLMNIAATNPATNPLRLRIQLYESETAIRPVPTYMYM